MTKLNERLEVLLTRPKDFFNRNLTLYRYSLEKSETIKPTFFNVGTKISKGRESSFWSDDISAALSYSIASRINRNFNYNENDKDKRPEAFKVDLHKYDKSLPNRAKYGVLAKYARINSKIYIFLDKGDTKENALNALFEKPLEGYINTITLKGYDRDLGIGHNKAAREFTIDREVVPDKIEQANNYVDILKNSIEFVTNPDEFVEYYLEAYTRDVTTGLEHMIKYKNISIKPEDKLNTNLFKSEFIDYVNKGNKDFLILADTHLGKDRNSSDWLRRELNRAYELSESIAKYFKDNNKKNNCYVLLLGDIVDKKCNTATTLVLLQTLTALISNGRSMMQPVKCIYVYGNSEIDMKALDLVKNRAIMSLDYSISTNDYVFSHMPMEINDNKINIHGHLHSFENYAGMNPDRHINVWNANANEHPVPFSEIIQLSPSATAQEVERHEFGKSAEKLFKLTKKELTRNGDIMNKNWNINNYNTRKAITEEIKRIENIKALNESSDIVQNVADKQLYLLKRKLNETAETDFLNNTRSDLQGELTAIKDYEAHADVAEKAGYKDAANVLRDIAKEEKVHCGELQKVLDKYDTEHEKAIKDGKKEASEELTESLEFIEFKQFLKEPDFYNRLSTLSESVLDPINKERCKEIFNNNIMKANVKSFIMNIIKDFDKQVNFPIGIRNVYLIGSSSGYQYSETSDIDIEVETDITKAQLSQIIKIIPKGTLLPGTQKPINLFVLSKDEKYDFKNAENVYDIQKNRWLKQTEKSDFKVPYQYIKDLSQFFMNGCDTAISKFKQDKKEFEEYLNLNPETQEISEKEKMEAADRKLNDLRNDLDTMKMAHHVIFAFEQEGYKDYPFKVSIDMKNKDPRYSVNNLVYKMIDRFGYLDTLSKSIKECQELINKRLQK